MLCKEFVNLLYKNVGLFIIKPGDFLKEKEFMITHKMVVKDCQLYLITDLKGIVENLKRYENIEKIELESINGHKYIKLMGTRTMYGYKVENGGFYNIFNDLYYNPYQMETAEIIKISKTDGLVKKKVR